MRKLGEFQKKQRVAVERLNERGEVLESYDSIAEAAKNGFRRTAISQVINGHKKRHYGFDWRRKGEEPRKIERFR